jgi:hypothetical protein
MGLLTSGIYGRHGFTSLRSANLTSSLVSRLAAKVLMLGSTLYTTTWKPWVTPSGRSRLRQRASGRRILESDCIGWLTPRARGDAGGQRWKLGVRKNLEDQARMYGLIRGLTVMEVAAMSLSPTFCRRLMGIPEEWDACAPMETRSTRKPLKHS